MPKLGLSIKPQLIIFDCDGVLVDSEPLTNVVLARMISDAGWPMDGHECGAQLDGRTIKSVIQVVEQKIKRQLPDDWEDIYEQQIYALLADEVKVVAGVFEVIEHLENQKIPMCVASSGPMEKMLITLGRTGLWEKFHPNIFSATMVRNGKPSPELFLYAADKMGMSPENCLVIEDTPVGAQAARAAKMPCIGYAGGVFGHEQGLIDSGAVIIKNLHDLLEIL
ncbi:MAG: HAD family phosphatase [Robiginitomaculum sp.]|nr:HAD family phosphatase [Robiginitomaculum sp.]